MSSYSFTDMDERRLRHPPLCGRGGWFYGFLGVGYPAGPWPEGKRWALAEKVRWVSEVTPAGNPVFKKR